MSNPVQRLIAKHPRTQKLQVNILGGFLIKGGNVFITLILVRLLVQYLGKESYGVWVTVSSLATFATFLDMGLGNGLRNKLAEAHSKQQVELGRSYVSTSYVVFSIIQIVVLGLLTLLAYSLDWQRIFNTTLPTVQLQTIVFLTFAGFCVKLVVDIINYVLLAVQESALAGSIQSVTGIVTLALVWFLHIQYGISLTTVTIVSITVPVVVSIIYSIVIFKGHLKIYQPNVRSVSFQHLNALVSLGSRFFLIQLAVVIIFYTDNLLITYLFGPQEVTVYNIAYRYFNVVNTLFFIVVSPFWSAITEAQIKADFEWVRASYRNLQRCWLAVVLAVVLLISVASPVYQLWIDEDVRVPFQLNLCMGVFVLISCWNNVIASILNGYGKIRLQLFASVAAAVINIPLCVYFGRFLQMGSTGVILATIFSLSICSVVCTVQVHKILNQTAIGVWNR